ncbi:LamG domain-containing protein [Streptomyces goshikiensis]|uniref:LamG domain-containing protein n=1 Tax=Streptomyces goshikiensis TaxID=1942 RepID=UPI0036BC3F79
MYGGAAPQGAGLDSAHNDSAWHHVVFKREAGRLLLSVDWGTEFSAPAPTGDITPPGQFDIHVGARPDFPNQATGVKELFNGGSTSASSAAPSPGQSPPRSAPAPPTSPPTRNHRAWASTPPARRARSRPTPPCTAAALP